MDDFKYRWKDEVAPELNNDFKWRFAMDALKPKMQIEGPSVGSLLYAMNPKTSELGLKQMDSELNQQLAANANFDKRGDAAMKFMEQRVYEDIANKQFADKMALEQFKAQNVDAGHANSMISNYINALQTGKIPAIKMAEQQIRNTFPNADEIIAGANETAKLGLAQKQAGSDLDMEIPRGNGWKNPDERKNFIDKVNIRFNEGKIDEQTKSDLIKSANSIPDQLTTRSNVYINAQNAAGASRGVIRTEQQLIDDEFKRLKKLYPNITDENYLMELAKQNMGVKE